MKSVVSSCPRIAGRCRDPSPSTQSKSRSISNIEVSDFHFVEEGIQRSSWENRICTACPYPSLRPAQLAEEAVIVQTRYGHRQSGKSNEPSRDASPDDLHLLEGRLRRCRTGFHFPALETRDPTVVAPASRATCRAFRTFLECRSPYGHATSPGCTKSSAVPKRRLHSWSRLPSCQVGRLSVRARARNLFPPLQ